MTTHGESSDNSTSDHGANVARSSLYRRTDDEDARAQHDSTATSEEIGDETSGERSSKGSDREQRRDERLVGRRDAAARNRTEESAFHLFGEKRRTKGKSRIFGKPAS